MTMNSVCVFAVWMLSAITPLSAAPAPQTESTPPEFIARVKLEVNGLPQVKQILANAIAQQLQAIPGLQLVDANPKWTIRIETVAVPDEENKNIAGIGLSEVVLEHRPYVKMLQTLAQAWNYLLAAGILRQDQQLDLGLRRLVTTIEDLPQSTDSTTLAAHRMCVISVSNVDQACKDVVTDFDTKFIQPLRTSQSGGNVAADSPAVAAAPSTDQTK
jgi:hypothetical protein